jgi:hypothetical protein
MMIILFYRRAAHARIRMIDIAKSKCIVCEMNAWVHVPWYRLSWRFEEAMFSKN